MGASLTRGRWFPLAYLKALLRLDQPMGVELGTPLDAILAAYDAQVSYDAAYEHEVT